MVSSMHGNVKREAVKPQEQKKKAPVKESQEIQIKSKTKDKWKEMNEKKRPLRSFYTGDLRQCAARYVQMTTTVEEPGTGG